MPMYVCGRYRRHAGSWGEWSSWSGCSGTSLNETRTRSCTAECFGSNETTRACPQAMLVGEWRSWSSWSICQSKVINKTRTRLCYCSKSECLGRCFGQSTETVACPSVQYIGEWSKWNSWSKCNSKTVYQERTRSCACFAASCNSNNCVGKAHEKNLCLGATIAGEWGLWSFWGTCNEAISYVTRDRTCFCKGSTCPGQCFSEGQQTRYCGGNCPPTVSGQWTQWSLWSECPGSCGQTSKSVRQRFCLGSVSSVCQGLVEETKSCRTPKCCLVYFNSSTNLVCGAGADGKTNPQFADMKEQAALIAQLKVQVIAVLIFVILLIVCVVLLTLMVFKIARFIMKQGTTKDGNNRDEAYEQPVIHNPEERASEGFYENGQHLIQSDTDRSQVHLYANTTYEQKPEYVNESAIERQAKTAPQTHPKPKQTQ